MRYIKFSCLIILFFSIYSCSTKINKNVDDGIIKLSFIQINDVYEIQPLEMGHAGGMARVATQKKLSLKENPNTFLVMAGDFLSPSIYNSLKVNGVRVRGRQMVEAMNVAGTDLAMFGNHEFDINENELQSRINESKFDWISSNTFHNVNNSSEPFYKIENGSKIPFPETRIINISDADGTTAKIGFIAVTLPFNKASYVVYTDPLEAAIKAYNTIKDSCDIVVAITHQAMPDDVILAERLPQLAIIMGGHEHDMRHQKVGNVWITKAHANAISVFKNDIVINKKNKNFTTTTSLIYMNDSVALDSTVSVVVKKWEDISNKNFASLGFDAKKIVINNGETLDGKEAHVRSQSTNLTRLVVKSMEAACPEADVAIVNSGSIRVDDELHPPISQYDILRTMPFGGAIVEVDMEGSLLSKILSIGLTNIGTGGFLQYSEKLTHNEGKWFISGKPIEDSKIYRVALTDFLLTGGESNLELLTDKNPSIKKVYPLATEISNPRSDIRLAIIKYASK